MKGMGSHQSVEWFTPRYIFDRYDGEYHFTTDPCTHSSNPLGCKVFYTKKDNGLEQPWQGNVWINPPYGNDLDKWIEKGAEYARSGSGTVVMLIAARTDTRRFHKYIWDKERGTWRDGLRVEFLDGRIKFLSLDGKPSDSAFFPSMVVIFEPMQIKGTYVAAR